MSFALTGLTSTRRPVRIDTQVSATPRRSQRAVRLTVAAYERLQQEVGEQRAERINRTVSSGQEDTLSPGDRAALEAAEQSSDSEGASAYHSATAISRAGDLSVRAPEQPSRLQRLVSAISGPLVTAPFTSDEQARRLTYGPGTLPPPSSRSGANLTPVPFGVPPPTPGPATGSAPVSQPRVAPSPYAIRLQYGAPAGSPFAAASEPGPRTSPPASPAGSTGAAVTPSTNQDQVSTFRNIDFSPIDGSPTLGSSTGPQLERLVGSIEAMTDQVNSGMQALASASTGLKGASPDERVQLLETLQNDPQLQELVKAGLMSWDDVMRPNPAEGSEGHVPGVGAGKPVIDSKKLAALQSKLSTAAQRQANDLRRVQQVVERRRTTAGAVPAAAGAFYPGLKVWTPPAFAPPVPPGRN